MELMKAFMCLLLIDLQGKKAVYRLLKLQLWEILVVVWNFKFGLRAEASDCVTYTAGGNKIVFGSGTKLYVNDSKLNSVSSVVKTWQNLNIKSVFMWNSLNMNLVTPVINMYNGPGDWAELKFGPVKNRFYLYCSLKKNKLTTAWTNNLLIIINTH